MSSEVLNEMKTDTPDNNADNLKGLSTSAENSLAWVLSIMDSIYDGILVIDETTVVRYINPEYTRITGVSREQIIGRPLCDVRPKAMLPEVVRAGKPMAGVFRREGGIEYVVDMAPIIISGKIAGGVSVLKDITEVKRLTLELKDIAGRTDQLKSIIHYAYGAKYRFKDILGSSDAIRQVVRLSERIAQGEHDILIFGESGTGKEMFAQSIHNESNRSEKPFIPISCATLTPTLIESELFGYEEGAFTGAKKGGKVGLFEIAEGGTIFLDEIGELPLEMQSKLLRTLQERTIRRVGKAQESPVDVRVIAANNRDLEAMVKEGKFRADLYYRLDVMSIHLPPLRDRVGDVRKLADHFLAMFCGRMKRHLEFSPEVYALLSQYRWPGNIRELIHVVEFATSMSEDAVIHVYDLPRALRPDPTINMVKGNSLPEIIRNVERRIIEDRLKNYGVTLSAKKRLANDLGISLASLYNKLKILGVTEEKK